MGGATYNRRHDVAGLKRGGDNVEERVRRGQTTNRKAKTLCRRPASWDVFPMRKMAQIVGEWKTESGSAKTRPRLPPPSPL